MRRPDRALVDALDRVLARGALTEDVTVLREVDPHTLGVTLSRDAATLTGRAILDRGYLSTTVDPAGAASGAAQPVLLELRVPPGTPAAYLDPFSTHRGERELLLGRGLRIVFHDATYDTRRRRWVLRATVSPEET